MVWTRGSVFPTGRYYYKNETAKTNTYIKAICVAILLLHTSTYTRQGLCHRGSPPSPGLVMCFFTVKGFWSAFKNVFILFIVCYRRIYLLVTVYVWKIKQSIKTHVYNPRLPGLQSEFWLCWAIE